MSIYRDVNFSLDRNIYNDVSILTDIDSIKSTLYNNLLIDNDEIPFDNSMKLDVYGLIHGTDQNIAENFFMDAIRSAALRDSRISEVSNLKFDFRPDEYSVIIEVSIKLKRVEPYKQENVSFNLILKRLY